MIELFMSGGALFMLPLLAASIAVIALGAERIIRFRQAQISYPDFRDEMQSTIRDRGVVAARRRAADVPGPVARVWEEGLGFSRLPFPLVRERMESAAVEEISRLERHLPALSVIAQVSPLVGILGTIWGMITSFRGLEGGLRLGAGIQGELVAGGIWQALVTTAAGLAVAIPATLLHHYLTGKVDRFVEALDRSVADLVAALVPLRAQETARKKPMAVAVE